MEGGGREEHPLTNSLVMRTLLSCDETREVLRNRLVCRSWRNESLAKWLKLDKELCLVYSPAIGDKYGGGGEQQKLMTLDEFHHLWRSGSPSIVGIVGVPPTRLWLQGWGQMFAGSRMELNSLDQWFWRWAATAHLSSLTLANCHFEERVAVFEEPFLRALPSLQQLTLRDCIVHPTAVAKMRAAHEVWAKQPGRLEYRRNLTATEYVFHGAPVLYDNELGLVLSPRAERNPDCFEHSCLRSLDVTLSALNDPVPLLFWGPLLEKLPQLRELRVGGTYDEALLPTFPDLNNISWGHTVCYMNRKLWIGEMPLGMPFHCPCITWPVSRPTHVGNFFPLFWEDTIRQVTPTLKSLHLLDFGGRAQEEGSLSACFLMDGVPPHERYYGLPIFPFRHLARIALDLGINHETAQRELVCLSMGLTGVTLRHLTLFRAPFGKERPRIWFFGAHLTTLELWGNVIHSWDSFRNLVNLQVLRWNTRCYDAQHKGKRVRHLLEGGRRAWPLFTQDLVAREKNVVIPEFPNLGHLNLDWGPLSPESWTRLAEKMPGIRTLKAVFTEEVQLHQVAQLWPHLGSLRLNHRSRIGPAVLGLLLPQFTALAGFEWEGCSCVHQLFSDKEQCQEVEATLRITCPNVVFTFPWKWAPDGKELVSHPLCEEWKFEKSLLEAAQTTASKSESVGEMEFSATKEKLGKIDRKMKKLAKQKEMLERSLKVEQRSASELSVCTKMYE